MSSGKSTWVKFVENNSVSRCPVYRYDSKTAALDDAKRMLGGCVRGEGRVEIWDVDPRTTVGEPVKVLR